MVSKNAVSVLAILFTFFACSEDKPDFSKNQQPYLALAADLYLMQVALEQAPQPMRDSLSKIYSNKIQQTHQKSSEDIDAFYRDLADYPEEALVFYDSLSALVTTLETKELEKSVMPDEEAPEN
jgi:hypothetical protein